MDLTAKQTVLQHAAAFAKKNAVMLVAMAAAAVTMLFVPPDGAYLGYFDGKTLACLFCVLAVVCALRDIRFFSILARRIVRRFRNTRAAILALVYITFIGSMLIANDMALLTFLPLGYFVLETAGRKKYMAFTFIMQNIAANLGGMLTPFGNPQNLYLYSRFHIPDAEFFSVMAPHFLFAVALITVCCLVFVRPEPLSLPEEEITPDRRRTAVYLALFALSVVMVFRILPYWIGLIVIPAVLLFLDREALRQVDYPLLFTFAFFFIFSGNMARIPAVSGFFSSLLEKSTLVVSALSCQLISNVPSAILLSRFTENYRELLVGVNIGGVGTLISSLASLITFREYLRREPGKAGRYLALFSLFNFAFLFLMLGFASLVMR
ncbi:MAG: citrate transporter [Clostridia bacterium]|nr:citrate transporter [Clostridia bacterium]